MVLRVGTNDNGLPCVVDTQPEPAAATKENSTSGDSSHTKAQGKF